jgi:Protein of unknown function (DUF1214)
MYFYTDTDLKAQQLVGKGAYQITFPKGQLPPVKEFWSLTVYNPEHVFGPNPINRFALGTRNKPLRYEPDGSLTIYISTRSPGKEKESSRIPAPTGNFSIWLRSCWPDQAILDGTRIRKPGNAVMMPQDRRSCTAQVREVPTFEIGSAQGGGLAPFFTCILKGVDSPPQPGHIGLRLIGELSGDSEDWARLPGY